MNIAKIFFILSYYGECVNIYIYIYLSWNLNMLSSVFMIIGVLSMDFIFHLDKTSK